MSPLSPSTRWLFGSVFVASLLIDLVRLRSEALNRRFFGTFPALLSPREADGTTGVPWFVLGLFLVLWLPGGGLVIPSILVFAFADPAAGTVGRLFGKHPVGKGTLEGSLAFFVTAVAVLIPFVGVAMALPVAAFVAVMEVLPMGLDDNFVIPVATAISLWTLSGVV